MGRWRGRGKAWHKPAPHNDRWIFSVCVREIFTTDKLSYFNRGANLAAATAQRAVLSQLPNRLLKQILLMPSLDTTPTTDPDTWSSSMREYADVPGLYTKDILWSRDMHTPNVEDRKNPEASPVLQTDERAFKGIAPAWIGVSELDALRNDGEKYAKKLRERGVAVELKTYHGELSLH